MKGIDGLRVKLDFVWTIGDKQCSQEPLEWAEGSAGRTLWAGQIPVGRVTSDGIWWHVAMYLPGRPRQEMTYRHPEIARNKAERYSRLWADHFLAGASIRNSVDSE